VKRAVLLVDHGSRLAEANALVEALARRLAARLPDCRVEFAHMEMAQPDVAAGLAACAASGAEEVVVQPCFLAPGRHTTQTIPELVAHAARSHPRLRVRIAGPLGDHEKLVDVLLDRIEAEEGGSRER
jgi:sirohydrochlorin ferrochelatase